MERKIEHRSGRDPLGEANALVEAGEPRRAIAILDAELAAGRGGLLTRLALGRALVAAGDTERALEVLRDVAMLAPGADTALAMGEALLAAGHLPTAIAEFERAVRLEPAFAPAQFALGCAWLEAGEGERAAEIFSALKASQPDFAPRLTAKIAEADSMRAAKRSAPAYVRHLFDQFSHDYDRRMLEELSYRAPLILRGLADMVAPAGPRTLDILDLGCGTGLSGEAFADLARVLDGVDLSPGMIGRARAREIYDALTVADAETMLGETARSYDLILAADMLVYLGDLGPLFQAARLRLKPSGFFLFTVEKKPGEDYELGPKRRYRHSEAYVHAQAAAAGLDVMGLLECSPREEAKLPVEGFAVALQRI
jgi:predicted TPR repeat methyltransferase